MQFLNTSLVAPTQTLVLPANTWAKLTIIHGGTSGNPISVTIAGGAMSTPGATAPVSAATLTITPHYQYGTGVTWEAQCSVIAVSGDASARLLVQW